MPFLWMVGELHKIILINASGNIIRTIFYEVVAFAVIKWSLPFQAKIALEDYALAGELESVGLEQLKEELIARGLKCGGTLQQRAQRLFATKGVPLSELDPSLFAKSTGSKRPSGKKK